MPGKKKPFIDKDKSVTFRLVHRSQKDPFIVDSEGGDRVLAPVSSSQRDGRHFPADDRSVASQASGYKRREEQAKFGVYFDDDYDYLQHLRETNEVVRLEPVEERFRVAPKAQTVKDEIGGGDEKEKRELRLPASLFETPDMELKIGLLNQAAPAPGPHPDMDPDIVAILDDDEGDVEFEELEDDFIVRANAPMSGDEEEDGKPEHVGDDEEMGSDFDGDDGRWPQEETRSRFTEYSMSSSVIPRTEGLQQLDARFEKIYEQYDDSEVGSLGSEGDDSDDSNDDDSVEEGLIDLNSKRMLEMADEFAKEQQQKRTCLADLGKFDDNNARLYDEDDEAEPMDRVYTSEKQDRFDCETIVSTYSNLYNHPTLIKEERVKKVQLNAKTGLPVGAFRGDSGLTKRNLNQLPTDEKIGTASVRSMASSIRPKDETPEERRLRKQTVKLERKERRLEKKANKAAFKDEELRMKTVDMNLKQNMQGLKLS